MFRGWNGHECIDSTVIRSQKKEKNQCELGCHVGIHFKRVGFELYIYICTYIYIYSLLDWWPLPMENPGYATVRTDLVHYQSVRPICVGSLPCP